MDVIVDSALYHGLGQCSFLIGWQLHVRTHLLRLEATLSDICDEWDAAGCVVTTSTVQCVFFSFLFLPTSALNTNKTVFTWKST